MSIVRFSPARAVGVTVGLAAAGSIFGALAGALVFAIRVVAEVGPRGLAMWGIYALGALVGGPLGALCAPLAGWLLLRQVPLGRAFLAATVGTIIGGAIGWLMRGLSQFAPIIGGAIGCVAAATLLRASSRKRGVAHALPTGGAA